MKSLYFFFHSKPFTFSVSLQVIVIINNAVRIWCCSDTISLRHMKRVLWYCSCAVFAPKFTFTKWFSYKEFSCWIWISKLSPQTASPQLFVPPQLPGCWVVPYPALQINCRIVVVPREGRRVIRAGGKATKSSKRTSVCIRSRDFVKFWWLRGRQGAARCCWRAEVRWIEQ